MNISYRKTVYSKNQHSLCQFAELPPILNHSQIQNPVVELNCKADETQKSAVEL